MKRYFVTGIGTGVGKTLVSAILTEALQADYWKPVQTGLLEGTDKDAVSALVSNPKSVFFNEAYLFKEPASPHLAAALENENILVTKILLPPTKNEHLIIEGAGGLLVPLNDKDYVIDLARQLDAEVILVCRNYLGCINHSLLSIDYLKTHGFKIKGLVLNGTFATLVKEAIVSYAKLPVLAEIEERAEVSKGIIQEWAQQVNMEYFI